MRGRPNRKCTAEPTGSSVARGRQGRSFSPKETLNSPIQRKKQPRTVSELLAPSSRRLGSQIGPPPWNAPKTCSTAWRKPSAGSSTGLGLQGMGARGRAKTREEGTNVKAKSSAHQVALCAKHDSPLLAFCLHNLFSLLVLLFSGGFCSFTSWE